MRTSVNSMRLCPVVSAELNSGSSKDLPVIISLKDKGDKRVNGMVFNMASRIKHHLPLVDGIACDLNLESINRLSRHPSVEYICFDSKVFALVDIARNTIGATIPQNQGYTGEGVTVAVIDTGVAPHNDLVTPENRIVGFKDFVNNKTEPYDDNGHGTHVAGIIASNGISSGGRYKGIAPDANILAIKALDETGGGNVSDIVSAISI